MAVYLVGALNPKTHPIFVSSVWSTPVDASFKSLKNKKWDLYVRFTPQTDKN